MKKIHILIATLLIAASTFAQSPKSFSYQAVVRDADGTELVSTLVSFRIKIRNAKNTVVYEEVHDRISTDEFGRVNLQIGGGQTVSGAISEIDWGGGKYSLVIELDVTGGTNYVLMGASQLSSVPFAMYAETAGNMIKDSIFINRDIVTASEMAGIYGQNAKALLEASSDSMSLKDFILKLFFPVTTVPSDAAPTVFAFTYGTGTSTTVPYSVWSTWTDMQGTVSFNYSIINQSILSPTAENANILSIQLVDADNSLNILAFEDPIPTISGFIISDNISAAIKYPANATEDYTVNYILKVSDEKNTVRSTTLSVTLEKAPASSGPPTPPTITSFAMGTGTTAVIPYSIWGAWTGGKGAVSFDYSITNQSKVDQTTEADITSIKLVDNSIRTTIFSTESPIPTETIGVIADNISYEITSPVLSSMTADYVINYALEVQDGTNTVYSTTPISVTLQKPTQLTGVSFTNPVSTYTFSRTDITSVTLNWTLTANDETVQIFVSDATGNYGTVESTAATGSATKTFFVGNNPSTSTTTKTYSLKVIGSVSGETIKTVDVDMAGYTTIAWNTGGEPKLYPVGATSTAQALTSPYDLSSGTTANYLIGWSINQPTSPNDQASDITLDGTSTGLSGGGFKTKAITIPTNAVDKTYAVSVTGDLSGAGALTGSVGPINWVSSLYRVLVTTNPCNGDGTTNLTETDITGAEIIETKAGGDWFGNEPNPSLPFPMATDGYSFDPSIVTGVVYFVFAFPTVNSGALEVFNSGVWKSMTAGVDADYITDEISFDGQTYKVYCGCGELGDTFSYKIVE